VGRLVRDDERSSYDGSNPARSISTCLTIENLSDLSAHKKLNNPHGAIADLCPSVGKLRISWALQGAASDDEPKIPI